MVFSWMQIDDKLEDVSSNAEWKLYEQLKLFFSTFKEATNETDGELGQTLLLVVPWNNEFLDFCKVERQRFNNLAQAGSDNISTAALETLKNATKTKNLDLSDAAHEAYIKLEKYFNISSDFAILAVVLDPRHKITFYEDPKRSPQKKQANVAKSELNLYMNTTFLIRIYL